MTFTTPGKECNKFKQKIKQRRRKAKFSRSQLSDFTGEISAPLFIAEGARTRVLWFLSLSLSLGRGVRAERRRLAMSAVAERVSLSAVQLSMSTSFATN